MTVRGVAHVESGVSPMTKWKSEMESLWKNLSRAEGVRWDREGRPLKGCEWR